MTAGVAGFIAGNYAADRVPLPGDRWFSAGPAAAPPLCGRWNRRVG
ncbi:hypothetical protein [Streptomyces katsurahamanus]|nr:hypothetical protein [Streptomyces katsurahamanus]